MQLGPHWPGGHAAGAHQLYKWFFLPQDKNDFKKKTYAGSSRCRSTPGNTGRSRRWGYRCRCWCSCTSRRSSSQSDHWGTLNTRREGGGLICAHWNTAGQPQSIHIASTGYLTIVYCASCCEECSPFILKVRSRASFSWTIPLLLKWGYVKALMKAL